MICLFSRWLNFGWLWCLWYAMNSLYILWNVTLWKEVSTMVRACTFSNNTVDAKPCLWSSLTGSVYFCLGETLWEAWIFLQTMTFTFYSCLNKRVLSCLPCTAKLIHYLVWKTQRILLIYFQAMSSAFGSCSSGGRIFWCLCRSILISDSMNGIVRKMVIYFVLNICSILWALLFGWNGGKRSQLAGSIRTIFYCYRKSLLKAPIILLTTCTITSNVNWVALRMERCNNNCVCGYWRWLHWNVFIIILVIIYFSPVSVSEGLLWRWLWATCGIYCYHLGISWELFCNSLLI